MNKVKEKKETVYVLIVLYGGYSTAPWCTSPCMAQITTISNSVFKVGSMRSLGYPLSFRYQQVWSHVMLWLNEWWGLIFLQVNPFKINVRHSPSHVRASFKNTLPHSQTHILLQCVYWGQTIVFITDKRLYIKSIRTHCDLKLCMSLQSIENKIFHCSRKRPFWIKINKEDYSSESL